MPEYQSDDWYQTSIMSVRAVTVYVLQCTIYIVYLKC